MSTYKVIQDIEAEDKLLGPFGLRQFIYLIIVAVSAFVAFKLSAISPLLVLPFIPHCIFFLLLAAPFGHDQSTEVWLLAKIRFMLKPRVRTWNQTGIQQLVTITAPKKIEKVLTKNMDQAEVRSRLEALANTIDSRGWAIKNVNVNMFAQPMLAGAGSDRLVGADTAVQAGPDQVVDMLDTQSSPTAQNLDKMISASSQAHREQVVQQMQSPATAPPPTAAVPPAQPGWFAQQPQDPGVITPAATPTAQNPDPTTDDASLTEQQLLEKIHAEKAHQPKNYGHMRVIKPIAEQQAEAIEAARAAARAAADATAKKPPVTPAPDPAILELANNDDLNVATIARQANKQAKGDEPGDGEVVISLH